MIACTWSEQIRDFDAWQDRVFPRIAALAEKGWAQPADIDPSKPSWETWRDEVLIKQQIPRYEAMDVNYWSRNRPEDLRRLGSDQG